MPRPADRDQSPIQDVTQASRAIDLFTNRQGAIEAFGRHVSAPEGSILPVLHFYGVGGSGKSWLLEKLKQTAAESDPPVPCATVDFHHETQRGLIAALIAFKSQFERRHGISFPEFDLIWAVLMEQQGGAETSLVRQFTPGTNMAMAAVEAIAGAPVSALGAGVGSLFASLSKRYPNVEQWIRKVGGTQRVLELRTYTTERLLGELVRAFAAELAANAPARPDCACRAVLFFDTYEKLWEHTDGPTSPQGREKDRWIRELYAELLHDNAVLPVIAGRDYLCWPEVDPDWREDRDSGALCTYLDAHILGGLSAQDTQRYLSRCGVGRPPEDGAPEPLQAAIIGCSSSDDPDGQGCLPFYVGLCANIVLNERRPEPDGHGADPPAEWFQAIPDDRVAEDLASRFLTSLPSTTDRNLVTALSVARWFDEPLLAARLGNPDSASAAWERLEDYSFTEVAGDGRLRFHAIMREALLHIVEHEDPRRVAELHEWFRGHWQGRFNDGDATAEVEEWYHLLHIEPTEAFVAWSASAQQAQDERDGPRARALIAWWDGVDITGPRWQARMGDECWAAVIHTVAYWLDQLRHFANTHAEVISRAIALYEAALRVYQQETFPDEWATTQSNLGIAHNELPTGDRDTNLRRAVRCFEAVLRVRTEDEFPLEWGRTQNNLGRAYMELPTGDPTANLHQAIACFEAAIRIHTEDSSRVQWAMSQHNMGGAYASLPSGDRGANLRRAISCYAASLRVRTEAEFPRDWATTQKDLGLAYSAIPIGDQEENLRKAISCYEAALRVFKKDAIPVEWAATQLNLGNAYRGLATGDAAGSLQRAIGCYEAALQVYTQAAFPDRWARVKHNLGAAYQSLPVDDRAASLRRAMACHQAALRVYTEAAFPADWATTQNSLGTAYYQLPIGDRGENLARAIECYQAALRVYTEESFPQGWAMTQNNLGNVYRNLPTGDRGENLARAVECCRAALRVYKAAAFPQEWAKGQTNLGLAYADLRTGDQADSLQRAISCFKAALRIMTETGYPQEWGTIQSSLADAYARLPKGNRASNLRRAIQHYEAALRVRTQTEQPRVWAGIQNSLGSAWSDLPTGDRTANLMRAIDCYTAACRVFTETTYPEEWATVQNSLGNACSDLSGPDADRNRQRAIGCYEKALRVYTETAFPLHWARIQRNLGIVYQDLSTGDTGANLQKAMSCHEAALGVFTKAAFPAEWADTQGSLGHICGSLQTGDRRANLLQAIGHYVAALGVSDSLGPEHDWTLIHGCLGIALGGLPAGEWCEELQPAITHYEAALGAYTEPLPLQEWGPACLNLALAYRAAGLYELGCQVLSRFVDACPEVAGARYLLACALALAARTEEAIDHLAQAIDLDGEYRHTAADHEAFASLRADPRFQALVAPAP